MRPELRSKEPETRIHVEAELDRGVTGRLLDLLSAENRFPTTFALERKEGSMALRLGVPERGEWPRSQLLGRIRAVPGVRTVTVTASPE